jgi:DNA polymerase III delta prime subunit
MRKRDLSINEFQKGMNFALKTIYELNNKFEKKIEDETTKLKKIGRNLSISAILYDKHNITRSYKIFEPRDIPN